MKVFAVYGGIRADNSADLAVNNPAPAALNNLVFTVVGNTVMVKFDAPGEADVVGVSVWASQTEGFVANAGTLAIDQSTDPVLGIVIDEGETWYLRAAATDLWEAIPLS